jgi:hypothetical protein
MAKQITCKSLISPERWGAERPDPGVLEPGPCNNLQQMRQMQQFATNATNLQKKQQTNVIHADPSESAEAGCFDDV